MCFLPRPRSRLITAKAEQVVDPRLSKRSAARSDTAMRMVCIAGTHSLGFTVRARAAVCRNDVSIL